MAILGFLKGLNWVRIGLYAAIAAAIFGMGYMKASAVHAKHEADVQKQITAAVVAKEKQLREEFLVRLEVERAARTMLENDLTALRENRDQLIEAVRIAQLTKPVSAITVEGCMESDDENVRVVLGNPFSADFVRLWNDASRGRLPGTDPDAEAR